MPAPGASHGFTLLELMVVMVIVSVLAGAVLIRFDGAFAGMELRSASRDLASALRYARGRAIATQRETGVAIDVEERRYRILGTDDGRVRSFSGKIHVDLLTDRSSFISETEGAIRFFADGSSTGGDIRLTSDAGGYVVQIEWLTGRVRIGVPDPS